MRDFLLQKVKIITEIRRGGKSIILEQIMEEIKEAIKEIGGNKNA